MEENGGKSDTFNWAIAQLSLIFADLVPFWFTKEIDVVCRTYTASQKSLYTFVSVSRKSTLITGSAGGAGSDQPTSKMGMFFDRSLTLNN